MVGALAGVPVVSAQPLIGMAGTFVRMARTWLAVVVIIFRATGGFSMGSGFVPSRPIPPGHVISASSGWTQIFEVLGLGLVQMHLFHYRLEFRHGFQSLWFPGRLRRGLVGVLTSNMGKVPGGFGTTRVATLWFSFTSGKGIAPSLLFIRGVICLQWLRTGGCSTMAGLTHGAALLEDFWWWRVDSGEWVGKRVLGRFLCRLFL